MQKRTASSDQFRANMDLYLRNSPNVARAPPKCAECQEFHVVANEAIYCMVCHHPIQPHEIVEAPTITPDEVEGGIISHVFSFLRGRCG